MKEYQYNVYGGFGSVVVEDDATSEEIMAKILSLCEYDYWLVDHQEESIFKTLDAIDRKMARKVEADA